MNILNILKAYKISITSRMGAVQDVTSLTAKEQRMLFDELFPDITFKYPKKMYLLELMLKYAINDIILEQRTIPFNDVKDYKKYKNKANKLSKESIYAEYKVSTQKNLKKIRRNRRKKKKIL